MAKQKKTNVRDLVIGIVIGFLIALVLSSILNAYIFKTIIKENRAQSAIILELMERN